MQTTLNKIRAQGPCGLDPRKLPATGFQKLRNYLGRDFDPDKLFSLRVVFESNGFDDAVWCLRAVEGKEKEIRLLAVAFARQVQHLMTDPRSIKVLDVAEAFAHGLATAEELKAAYAAAAADADAAAAYAAAAAADADAYAADADAYAAYAAAADAYAAAAYAAAAYAAAAAADADAYAAAAYAAAAYAAAAAADAYAYAAARAKQTEILLSFLQERA